ncbi:MAG: ABC transporter ATP-binding protein [Planctomycetes bacterium]|nr:ABC transporter ATP-binding protein [Planctomycetota bacterium]MBI3845076.1 ABC transporter ATP-binding protein [Planctomycetota bacterium]
MASVDLERVTKVYPRSGRGDSPPAVRDVSIEVRDREFLVLVGPSGCGKSTILRLIAGLEHPDSGAIRIGGRDVAAVAPRDRDIAMVFQSYALYPHLTVRKNLSFPLDMRRVAREDVRRRVESVAGSLGLTHLLDRKPRALSGGEKQRVALGRAIVREPKAFLFDEPLSNLDAKLRAEMRGELRALHDRLRTTMIFVTHDQIEAMTLGHRIVVLRAGEVQQVGPPLEVHRRPSNRWVAGFIGTPPMNFVRGRVETVAGRRSARVGCGIVELPADLAPSVRDGTDVELGIRPEDVHATSIVRADEPSSMTGVVCAVEALGDHTLVRLTSDAGDVVAKLSGRETPTRGTPFSMRLDPDDVHVFSMSDGSSLRGSPDPAMP